MIQTKKALFIYTGFGFFINAIQNSLISFGFEVTHVGLSAKELRDKEDRGEVVVLYLGNFAFQGVDFLRFVKNFCFDTSKPLFIIGDNKEMDAISEIIPVTPAFVRFERPFIMKEFSKEVSRVLDVARTIERPWRILAVDDEPEFLRIVHRWLSRKYDVTIVASAEEALDSINMVMPDLILLDYEMPEVNGLELMEIIREKLPNMPMIFLTGKDGKDEVLEVLLRHPERYVLKTAERDMLMTALDEHFHTRSQVDVDTTEEEIETLYDDPLYSQEENPNHTLTHDNIFDYDTLINHKENNTDETPDAETGKAAEKIAFFDKLI
ncbi:MAG: response regulator [Lachnospiraceae bacterium]|nr:response regulator [Lachnospiraceae bacterium]